MLISSIVLVVVRVLSLNWLIIGLLSCALAIGDSARLGGGSSSFMFLPSVLEIVLSVIAWFCAPYCSRWVPGSKDTLVSAISLSLQDLYSFAFVFLGLYYALGSLGELATAFHQWLSSTAGGPFEIHRSDAGYRVVRLLVSVVAGCVCVFSGSGWAEKLCRSVRKTHTEG